MYISNSCWCDVTCFFTLWSLQAQQKKKSLSLSLLVFLFSFHFPIIFRSFYFHRRLAALMRFLVAKFNHMNVMLILFFWQHCSVCVFERVDYVEEKKKIVGSKLLIETGFFSLSLLLSISYLQPKALNLFLCHVNSSNSCLLFSIISTIMNVHRMREANEKQWACFR